MHCKLLATRSVVLFTHSLQLVLFKFVGSALEVQFSLQPNMWRLPLKAQVQVQQ